MNFVIEDFNRIPEYIRPLREKKIHSGGNSSVYEWESLQGSFIVKKFSGSNSNIIERFEREKSSLILLDSNEVQNVPKLLYSDFDAKIIITNKLPGNKPVKVTLDIFMQYFNTSRLLQSDRITVPKELIIKNASDSLLEPFELISKIRKEFNEVKISIKGDFDACNKFYSEAEKIINEREKCLNEIKGISQSLGHQKIFSFSDLGPRNMLLDDSKLYFVDFEHAGWDNPIKGIIDLLICPSNNITNKDIEEIVEFLLDNKEDSFIESFLGWLPILNIKWVIIYIKYNSKLHQCAAIKIERVKEIYLKGCKIIKNIESRIEMRKI